MVKIQDIARMAGVSVKTVTRAFKRDSVISAEKRRIILELAEKYDYKPNYAAGRLSSNIIKIYAFVLNIIEDFGRDIISGLEEAGQLLEDSKVEITITDISSKTDDEIIEFVKAAIDDGASAIITSFSYTEKICDFIATIDQEKLPWVTINDAPPAPKPLFTVTSDIITTGRLACELISMLAPETDNLVFTGNLASERHRTILNNYQAEAERRGVRIAGVYDTCDVPENGVAALERALREVPEPGSIYITSANSDGIIASLIKHKKEGNPAKKIRIVASDLYSNMASYLSDGYVDAVIFQDPRKQAKLAVMKLYEYIIKDAVIPQTIQIMPQIVLQNNLKYFYK